MGAMRDARKRDQAVYRLCSHSNLLARKREQRRAGSRLGTDRVGVSRNSREQGEGPALTQGRGVPTNEEN